MYIIEFQYYADQLLFVMIDGATLCLNQLTFVVIFRSEKHVERMSGLNVHYCKYNQGLNK